jgi:hypothetical protein
MMIIKSLTVKTKSQDLVIIDLVLSIPAHGALPRGWVRHDEDGNEVYPQFTFHDVRVKVDSFHGYGRIHLKEFPMLIREAMGFFGLGDLSKLFVQEVNK